MVPWLRQRTQGIYTVVGTISDPNYYGSATNILVVGLPPGNIYAHVTNSHQLILQLTGTPNFPYILQTATNLTPPVIWEPILTNPADARGNWSDAVTNQNDAPAHFYRAAGQ